MKSLIHGRGDVLDMFLLFMMLTLGLWQLLVAWKRLNGLSLTGYPDRKYWSIAAGLTLIIGSGAWYFSQPGHFASPDVEGIESFILLAFAIPAATAVQFSLSLIVQRAIARSNKNKKEIFSGDSIITELLQVDVEGSMVPCSYYRPVKDAELNMPILLMHDYGGTMEDMDSIARFLTVRGHPVLAFDLDGHGKSQRGISGPFMETTSVSMISTLCRLAGRREIAIAGIGFGGLAAMYCARVGSEAARVVAIDPTAFGADGACAVNSLRELDILDVITALILPGAVDENRKRRALSSVIEGRELTELLPSEKIALIATQGHWLNSPGSSKEFAASLGLKEPALVAGNHYSLVHSEEVRNLLLENISS